MEINHESARHLPAAMPRQNFHRIRKDFAPIQRANAKLLGVIPLAQRRSLVTAGTRQFTWCPTDGCKRMESKRFRFLDSHRNYDLQRRLQQANIPFKRDDKDNVCFSAGDEERIENEIIRPMRDQRFPSWQLLFCPRNWAARYREYMTQHNVPFEEQWVDNDPCFLIPRKCQPHRWNIQTAAQVSHMNR